MKIKGKVNKIFRVNSNSVSCDAKSFNKLKEGNVVDVPDGQAQELLNMGVAEKATAPKKTKKEGK